MKISANEARRVGEQIGIDWQGTNTAEIAAGTISAR
jgi:hypothetical protein